MVKPRLYNKEDTTKPAALWTLKTVLINSLKLLHPYMPFLTEEIFCILQEEETKENKEESIMISAWPDYKEEWNFKQEEKAVELMKQAVKGIRNVRTQMNVPLSKKTTVIIVSKSEKVIQVFKESKSFFTRLAYATEVKIQQDKQDIDSDAVSIMIQDGAIYLPFHELVDLEKEINRLEKEKIKLEGELKRVNGMLQNEKFREKAPKEKIEEEERKKEKYNSMMEQVLERLNQLKR